MALKLLKYPKKPKQSASIATKENYLRKVAEINRENAKRKALNNKSKALSAKIAKIGAAK